MSTILDQAPEVLHDIFCHIEPSDLASVARTCHFLNKFIDRDALLWRRQYLQNYDPPATTEAEPEWQHLLKRNTSMHKLLSSTDESLKTEEQLQRVGELIDSLLLDSVPRTSLNTAWLRRQFINHESESNVSSFLCRSSLFRGARLPSNMPASSAELRQLSAKLHVFSGLGLEYSGSRETRSADIQPVHPYARARVYDLRRYKAANHWGPFMDDGSSAVDWEKVQAIMLDLLYNVHSHARRGGRPIPRYASPDRPGFVRNRNTFASLATGVFDKPFWGLAPNSYRSRSLADAANPLRTPPSPDLDALDPYGVSGTWMRIVCFLDYSDLYNFNFDAARNAPHGGGEDENTERGPIDTREAFRLIRLHLHVTSVDEPGEDDHKGFPVVSFVGTSRSMLNSWDPNANSRIRGVVRTTLSGAIRWTTWSTFHGEERWRSEGVQIGGIKSARGILGNWFDKDYDAAGPAGPTAFWKLSDDVVDEKKPTGHHHSVGGLHGLQHQGWWSANGADDDSDEDDDDADWVDEDEENNGGEGNAGDYDEDEENGNVVTLGDVGTLFGGGGGGGIVIGGGPNGQGGVTLPLHQVLQLLREALEGGQGEDGNIILSLEDFQRFAE